LPFFIIRGEGEKYENGEEKGGKCEGGKGLKTKDNRKIKLKG
jgi:hypothetical protein